MESCPSVTTSHFGGASWLILSRRLGLHDARQESNVLPLCPGLAITGACQAQQ